MRNYELMLVTPTSLSKDQEDEFLKKITETIKKNGGEVTSQQPLGKKKLAYPISGQNEGIYTLMEFKGKGKTIDGLEKFLKISGEVLRHGIFKKELKEKK